MKTIEIFVSPTGESRVETKGFSGDECQRASSFLEQALGKRATATLKPEFYSQTQTKRSVQNEN